MQSAPVRERSLYVDVLRVIACFLVIVNHTNSRVFQHSDPSQAIWYLSMGYYYLAKTAVPLFVMISGICLLGKDDSPRRALGRFLRMLAVTVLFSYLYYCYHHDWSFVYATSPRAFLESLWDRPATDAFWYLYMYLGLLLCMPLMQRLVKALSKGWLGYFLLVSLGVLGAWPLAQHYFPSLKAPMFFDLPMFGLFLGLLAAGHYLRVYVKTTRRGVLIASLVLPASLVACVLMTRAECLKAPESWYWFMDDRVHPSTLILLMALSAAYLARAAFENRTVSPRAAKRWALLGEGTFAVYLLQDFAISVSTPLYNQAAAFMGMFPAVLLWEIAVFIVCMAVALVLKRLPGVRKLI